MFLSRAIMRRGTNGWGAQAQGLARDIAANAPLGVREAKRMFDEIEHLALAEALEHSRAPRMALNDTRDFREGVTAFAEKRRPNFIGE